MAEEQSVWRHPTTWIVVAVSVTFGAFRVWVSPWLEKGGWETVKLWGESAALVAVIAVATVVAVWWRKRREFRARRAERRVTRHINAGLAGLPGTAKQARAAGVKVNRDDLTTVSVKVVHDNVVHLDDRKRKQIMDVVTARSGLASDAMEPRYHGNEKEPWLGLSRTGTAVLPELVPMPAVGDRPDCDRLPYGVHTGGVQWWDPSKQAHCLVSGGTGSGKTALIRVFVFQAWARGWQIFVVDPKKIEFREVDGLDGVSRSGDKRGDAAAVDMAAMIDRVHTVMEDRYDLTVPQIERLPRIMFVVDEVGDLVDTLNPWWKANKPAGQTGTEHPQVTQLGKIARLGRSARIHIVYGIQRPDAKIVGGNTRAQFGHRVSVGPLDDDGARMMWDNRWQQACETPATPGRAAAGAKDDPRQVQIWWVSRDAMADAVAAVT